MMRYKFNGQQQMCMRVHSQIPSHDCFHQNVQIRVVVSCDSPSQTQLAGTLSVTFWHQQQTVIWQLLQLLFPWKHEH